jgi:hypothetical protein
MSRALGAAKQRRAGVSFQETQVQPPPAMIPSITHTQPVQNGLTLPQVISLVDSRLVKLEKHMNESNVDDTLFNEVDERFTILASEIQELKEVVYKLQTYTMEVNKKIVENVFKTDSKIFDSDNKS